MTTFFFDNNLSQDFARALSVLGIDVRALRDQFPHNTEDTVWLAEIGQRGWVLITHDRGITTKSAEARALRASGITAIFIGRFWGKTRRWEQFQWLVKHWPKIEEFVATNPAGTVGLAQTNGTIKYIVV